MKRICILGHLIQPPIIFKVKFVLWILQVSCSAQHLLLVFLLLAKSKVFQVYWSVDFVFAQIIIDGVHHHLLEHQHPEQSGFTPKRSTIDRILALWVLTERR